MLIRDIFMELRTRLRSCNVYITTGVDFTKNCNLKISLQSNCIVLNYYDSEPKRRDSLSSIESLSDYSEDESDVTSTIPIDEYCHIIPNSMSSLKIDKNNISFRILTQPVNGGNFYKELLSTNNIGNNYKSDAIKINVVAGCEVKILCGNCSNVVSNGVIKFDRVLELPSANLDMADWFCHGHSHGGHDDAETAPEITIKPNKNDFLYRLTFFVINNSSMSEKTNKFNIKRNIYHCNRCLAWLGLKVNDTVKLFNSTVKLLQGNIEKTAMSHKLATDSLTTDDFIYTIENMIKDFNLGFQYTVMCKIVLETIVSASKKQYLLIWVMDKELQVLRSTDRIDCERIELQSTLLTKILYKIEMSLNEEVEMWLADPAVVSTEISKCMFVNGVEHLQKMSLKVPETFRNTNGYHVSYLKA